MTIWQFWKIEEGYYVIEFDNPAVEFHFQPYEDELWWVDSETGEEIPPPI